MFRFTTGLLLELLLGKVIFFSIGLLSRGFPLDSDDVLAHHSHAIA